MIRTIVVAVILAAIGYFLIDQQRVPNADRPIVYTETQLQIRFAQSHRDLKFAIIDEYRSTDTGCVRPPSVDEFVEECKGTGDTCSVIKNKCTTEVHKQYLNMLNEQPNDVTYLHGYNSKTRLRSIMVFWGVTVEESAVFCEEFKSEFKEIYRTMDLNCI